MPIFLNRGVGQVHIPPKRKSRRIFFRVRQPCKRAALRQYRSVSLYSYLCVSLRRKKNGVNWRANDNNFDVIFHFLVNYRLSPFVLLKCTRTYNWLPIGEPYRAGAINCHKEAHRDVSFLFIHSVIHSFTVMKTFSHVCIDREVRTLMYLKWVTHSFSSSSQSCAFIILLITGCRAAFIEWDGSRFFFRSLICGKL